MAKNGTYSIYMVLVSECLGCIECIGLAVHPSRKGCTACQEEHPFTVALSTRRRWRIWQRASDTGTHLEEGLRLVLLSTPSAGVHPYTSHTTTSTAVA